MARGEQDGHGGGGCQAPAAAALLTMDFCLSAAVLAPEKQTTCYAAAFLPARLVQEPGSFVVVLPNAYHSWLSTGFSIHESVALAPWDCLGAGADAERSCRQQHAPTALSHTELLVTLVSHVVQHAQNLQIAHTLQRATCHEAACQWYTPPIPRVSASLRSVTVAS